jgi:hypothetical protein
MTQDEKRLLKHGLVAAALFAGFWLMVIAVKNHVITAIAMIIWSAFLYAVFYLNAHKNGSK